MSKRTASIIVSTFRSWRQLLRDYDLYHRPKREEELEWFTHQETFEQLLGVVARAERNGKRLDHQRRIRREAIPAAERSFRANAATLRSARSFEALLAAVDHVVRGIRGIGRLYRYDAALRLGAFLGIAPEYVYLHAGTRKGAKAFVDVRRRDRLCREDLPIALRSRSPAEIENILCVYERSFAGGILRSSLCGRRE